MKTITEESIKERFNKLVSSEDYDEAWTLLFNYNYLTWECICFSRLHDRMLNVLRKLAGDIEIDCYVKWVKDVAA